MKKALTVLLLSLSLIGGCGFGSHQDDTPPLPTSTEALVCMASANHVYNDSCYFTPEECQEALSLARRGTCSAQNVYEAYGFKYTVVRAGSDNVWHADGAEEGTYRLYETAELAQQHHDRTSTLENPDNPSAVRNVHVVTHVTR